MSTSKARRKRREWMQKLQDKREKDIAAEKARSARELRGLREDLTRMIPNDDEDTFYPCGKIEQPYLQVACTHETFDRFSPDKFYGSPMGNPFFERIRVFALQAEQFALVLPDGRKVVWWGWKLR